MLLADLRVGSRQQAARGSIVRTVARPRLVFLYGPPAVGKLSVAKALADRMPAKILHNHLTIDPVAAVLPFGTDAFWRVVGRFRRDLVSAAAEEGIDLIYTYVFAPGDERHVADTVSAFEAVGGDSFFVRLVAPRDVLVQRVIAEDRKLHGKITDPAQLERLLEEYDTGQEIPGRASLTLDTAATTPAEAAELIVAHISHA